MDVLSNILSDLQLQGSIYFSSHFCRPWGISINSSDKASFHIVEKGRCWLKMAHLKQAIPLESGDVIVLPHGCYHELSDDPETLCRDGDTVINAVMTGQNPFASGGEPLDIVCGYFKYTYERRMPFINALPELIILRQQDRNNFNWLDMVLNLVVSESRATEQGKNALLNRVTEILFIQVLRAYIELNQSSNGFISALNDNKIAKALTAIHQSPANDWTVDSLAEVAGMSRTSFATSFHSKVGDPPISYLLSHRMHKAKQRIRDTNLPLNLIAEEVGYQSDSAFKKAFKRYFEATPASFRQGKNTKPIKQELPGESPRMA